MMAQHNSITPSIALVPAPIETVEQLNKLGEQGIRNVTVISSPGATQLPKKGNVFCMVVTQENMYSIKIPAINQTWLRHCDHGEFFTNKLLNDSWIPYSTVFVGLDDTKDSIFYKALNGFNYAYTRISAEFEWYMKTDDDTYIIMEHLKEYLTRFRSSDPVYLRYSFDNNVQYHTGRAGYLLSNAAVKLLVDNAFANRTICPFHKNEDEGIGQCLQNLGINPTNFPEGQKRFIPNSMLDKIIDPEVISLHYQSPMDMQRLETYLYKLKTPQQSRFYNNKLK